jgi:NAD(P)-dependent dehydrogenase (short-subunit alcohol dehydrogenase family)
VSDLPPSQEQPRQPGLDAVAEARAEPSPASYRPAERLAGSVALIASGESGLGRTVALGFAREGADVAITYLDQHEDAEETVRLIEAEGRQALAIPGDIGNSDFAREVVRQTVSAFGRIDVLVNNAVERPVGERLEELSDDQLERTFRMNVFSQFFLTRSALPEMPDGSAIVNTVLAAEQEGSKPGVDHSSARGAAIAFTRALSRQLAGRRIRVNAVAVRPALASFEGVLPGYVFLATREAAYFSGQVLHPSGGGVAND